MLRGSLKKNSNQIDVVIIVKIKIFILEEIKKKSGKKK